MSSSRLTRDAKAMREIGSAYDRLLLSESMTADGSEGDLLTVVSVAVAAVFARNPENDDWVPLVRLTSCLVVLWFVRPPPIGGALNRVLWVAFGRALTSSIRTGAASCVGPQPAGIGVDCSRRRSRYQRVSGERRARQTRWWCRRPLDAAAGTV